MSRYWSASAQDKKNSYIAKIPASAGAQCVEPEGSPPLVSRAHPTTRLRAPCRGRSARPTGYPALLRSSSALGAELPGRFVADGVPVGGTANPGDFVEYEILDQSVIVVRVDADHVRAYHNSCRLRGMKLVGPGLATLVRVRRSRLVLGPRRYEHLRAASELFGEANLDAGDLRPTRPI